MNNFEEDPNPNSSSLIKKLVNAGGNLLHLGQIGSNKPHKVQENNELKGQQLVNINK
ncbi:unnamed protein product [Paramecium sonneborni]|uniref:Uncharacterized protein n=1 Tax=Paramecium sonneborni TaxID=65129 RepID=A0A8S1JV27_9CILI|nr:unnamed protein product [Paramecium sonneborni]